jgi:hypothetical protein
MKTCGRLTRPPVVSFLAFLFLLCGAAFATRGRAMPEDPTLDARVWWTAADDTHHVLYTPTEAGAYLASLSVEQRALYGWTEVTLDVAFPLTYTGLLLALLCALGAAPDEERRGGGTGLLRAATALSLLGGASDLLENGAVAYLAFTFSGHATSVAWVAAAFTGSKYLCLIGAAVLAAAAVARSGHHRWELAGLLWLWATVYAIAASPVWALGMFLALAVVVHWRWLHLAQYLYFLRFPIAAGALLAFLPRLVGAKGATSLFGNLLIIESHVFWISFLGTLVALTVMSMLRLAFLTAPYRNKLPLRRSETRRFGPGTHTPGDEVERAAYVQANRDFVATYTPWVITARAPLFGLLAVPLLLAIRRVSPDPSGMQLVAGWMAAVGVAMVMQFWAEQYVSAWWQEAWDWLVRNQRNWMMRIVEPFVKPVGRILEGFGRKGHAPIVMMAIVAIGAYFALSPLFRQGWEGSRVYANRFPPIFYVFLVAGALIWLTTIVSLIFDRSRIPMGLAAVAWLGVGFALSRSDHFYRIVPDEGAMTALPTPTEVVRARHAGADGDWITVVAASGGGIKAAVWTARVLQGLQEDVGPDLTRSIVLLSTNSGGSVGGMYYTEAFEPAGVTPGRLRAAVDAAGESSLSAVVWGMAYPDLWRILSGGLVPGRWWPTLDRGWAMDRRWEAVRAERLGPAQAARSGGSPASANRPRRLGDWVAGVRAGWRPAHIFNATAVETGAAVRFATVALSDPAAGTALEPRYAPGSEPREFADLYPGADLDVATAARLSASFPWVSPMTRPWMDPVDVPRVAAVGNDYAALIDSAAFHLGDGGYFDNFGVFSTLDFLQRVDWSALSADAAHPIRRVILVEIRATPEGEGRPDRGGFKYSAFGPLLAMNAVRNSSQIGRNDEEVELLRREWLGEGLVLCRVVFPLAVAGPLSWHLTQDERAKLQAAWADTLLQTRAAHLRDYLDGPGTVGEGVCSQAPGGA